MFRRNKEEFVWSFDDDFLVACSNARVALALLRCGRGVPGALTHYHNCEGVARALVPAFLKCPTLLRKALRSPLGVQELGELASKTDLAGLLGDRIVLRLLGYAMASNSVAFAPLFDRVDRLLVSFIKSQTRSIDRNVEIVARILSLPETGAKFLHLAVSLSHTDISSQLLSFVEGAHNRPLKAAEEHGAAWTR